ncbi:DDE-type integrase/transposase/recombinase, partial [Frankia sp. Cr1]|uniref:DDE-type integrase/transposase/recombinase n=1 Tax=Frankia sp. Cr1 TaxID=3073931 RepID=UPI002AD46530
MNTFVRAPTVTRSGSQPSADSPALASWPTPPTLPRTDHLSYGHWAVADHMRTDLVLDALRMAITRRHPPKGVISHADRGSQYTSKEFVGFCKINNVRNSVGRTGICFDNAAAESFWATLK